MKLGLVGFPQVGKRTLFRLLTGKEANSDGKKGSTLGLARVRDRRFDDLFNLYAPRKQTPAHVEFVLLPDLDKEASRNEEMLRSLTQVDVICHLVRAFQDDTLFHIHGGVDPCRDIHLFNEELQLNDLVFIEKRLERLEKAWTNRQGALAPQAAGVIHSDFERAFIRAEVMKYQDLIRLGSEQKVRELGKFKQRGRDYVVEDGDIINFLFNVYPPIVHLIRPIHLRRSGFFLNPLLPIDLTTSRSF
jgi:ribosome-binding ATPase YchF (GTP1/OBG family)